MVRVVAHRVVCKAQAMSLVARVDPIPFVLKSDSTGLGKAAMDARIIEATVAQRRDLHSERLMKESEEQRKKREVSHIHRLVSISLMHATPTGQCCSEADRQNRDCTHSAAFLLCA